MSGLNSIHIEQQHVVAIEPDFDRVEIGERANEQTCPDQQQQRNGDLRDQEEVKDQSVDIDEPEDWIIAEALARYGLERH